MRYLASILALLLCVASSAEAQVTVHNYVIGSDVTLNKNQIYKTDTDGNRLESVGQLNSFIQVGTFPNQTFYTYGNALGCGVRFGAPSSVPPNPVDCGIMVYKSTDFVTWHKVGLLYTVGSLGSICPAPNVMCFTATMLGPRASDGHYIMWFQGSGTGSGAGFIVLDCTTPGGQADGGSCTRLADPVNNSIITNTAQPFLDDDGASGWLAYPNAGGSLVTSPLINNLTDFNSSVQGFIAGSSAGESLSMFRGPPVSGVPTYYATWGSACAFCTTGTIARYAYSTNPSSGWSSSFFEFDNSNSSCQSQLGKVFRMTLSGGAQTWILNGAQWTGTASEALASNYQVPLTFGTDSINLFNCVDSFTISGLTPESPPPANPALDQTSTNGYFYSNQSSYVIDGATMQMQTFTPTQGFLSSVEVWIPQVNATCPGLSAGSCGQVNGNLGLALIDLNQSTLDPLCTLTPSTILTASCTLISTTILNANVSWNSVGVSFPINLPVTPGHHYGIAAACIGTCNNGATYVQTRDLANSYSRGVARQWTNGSGVWTTQTSGTIYKFSSFGPAPGPGLRRRLF